MSTSTRLLRTLTISLLCLTALVIPTRADDALKTINNPTGGQIIYGPIVGETTLQGALVSMLRNVHARFGDRPQIGKLFQVRGTNSVATFFTVTAKTQGGKQIAGMVIATMPGNGKPAAAVLYDDANNFGKTANTLLAKLNDVWKADVAKSGAAGGEASRGGAVQPLHLVTFPDNSGVIGLPAGWKIDSAGSGSVHASGPRGESVHVAVLYTMYDPSTQQGQGMIRYLTMNGKPLPPGSGVYPYGGDLVKAFIAMAQQGRRGPAPTFDVTKVQKVQAPNNMPCVLATGEFNLQDGKGPVHSSIQITAFSHTSPASWGMSINRLSAPKAIADEEWPTLGAILDSERQNSAVLRAQAQAVVDRINQQAEANRKLADARSAANDAHNAAVYARWDDQAKASKTFQDYTLDRSVVVDNSTGKHGTIDNPSADALIKSDPNRFQLVPTQDLIKGKDY